MPFLPASSRAPMVAHVACADGFYWALSRTSRRGGFPCATVEARSLSVAQVAATYEGDAQTRAEALAGLREGERLALYPRACAGCGQDHSINAASLVRAWRSISASARIACQGLAVGAYLKIAAVRGDTPDQTAELQVLAAMAAGMRGARSVAAPPRSGPGLASTAPASPLRRSA
jgi:hypothetical protein